GGAAIVYRAYDPFLDKDVAIKIIKKKWAEDRKLRQRFAREAGVLRMLNDPGVPRFIELRKVNGTFAMIQELADGVTLHNVLKAQGMIDGQRCVPWFLQLLKTLAYIHGEGV